MNASPGQLQVFAAWLAAHLWDRDRHPSGEVLTRNRRRVCSNFRYCTGGKQLPAQLPSARTEIQQIVRSANDVRIVFHDQDRIAEVAQIFHDADKLGGIPCVQSDGRLIQNIECTNQTRTK